MVGRSLDQGASAAGGEGGGIREYGTRWVLASLGGKHKVASLDPTPHSQEYGFAAVPYEIKEACLDARSRESNCGPVHFVPAGMEGLGIAKPSAVGPLVPEHSLIDVDVR